MELTQLRYFQTVARLESFTRAAETLHVSQSALSKSIAKLEEELGFPLFIRDRNRIRLNRCGSYFLDQAVRTIDELDRSIRIAKDMAGLEQGEVCIGVDQNVFVKHLVRDFLIEFPQASVFCYLMSQEQMTDGLKKGTLDFVVSTDWSPAEGIEWEPCCQDYLDVVMAVRRGQHRHRAAAGCTFCDQQHGRQSDRSRL